MTNAGRPANNEAQNRISFETGMCAETLSMAFHLLGVCADCVFEPNLFCACILIRCTVSVDRSDWSIARSARKFVYGHF